MNNKEPRYPWSLFFAGLLINIISRIYFFVPGGVILIIGQIIDKDIMKAIGTCLLVAAFLYFLIDQIIIRNGVINSDSPNFEEWRSAMMSPRWKDNIKDLMEDKLQDESNLIELEDKDDDDDEDDYPGDIGFKL